MNLSFIGFVFNRFDTNFKLMCIHVLHVSTRIDMFKIRLKIRDTDNTN